MGRLQGLEFDSSYYPIMVASGVTAFLFSRVIFPKVSKQYVSAYRDLSEANKISWNNLWFFDTLKMKRTQGLPFINGVLMTLTFFFARIVTMPPYWYKVYTVYGTEEFDAVGHIKYVLYVTCISLDVMNSYWFYRNVSWSKESLDTTQCRYSKFRKFKIERRLIRSFLNEALALLPVSTTCIFKDLVRVWNGN
ncbi:hypothetical protein FSP39_001355 [Pinctada imbricata]|uniref:TLC domain-containing protein n=1 Tax=Pinctada imbricata TaxID=66713 RepID=A0AA88XV45_PINIB|nr:hypothetical protein FSP39_001355 [Pinctada imbricata]